MGRLRVLLFASAALLSCAPAAAADQLKFGPIPAWVTPQPLPPAPVKMKEQSAVVLLHDQQELLEPGRISNFSEVAYKIQKPEGLGAGNISLAWNPATDTVTVHKLEIRRGNQVIDVLASGQKFTTMRRESDLELAMLDGVLTANIQPEGLQQGDVLVIEMTTDRIDPVMKGHVEATFAPWSSRQIALAHAKLNWPSTLALNIKRTGDLPAPQQISREGRSSYELTMRETEPVIAPKGAPIRYAVGRMGEATDFGSWADAAELMAPLYREAAVISASGPLRDEVEKIRKSSNDSSTRAQQALALVQDRVRYVALLMGEGGYVPTKAEETWSRRFGDCKAKTALLLGMLHELGIQAEPVLVNARTGDIIRERLPMISLFNHVLVRAHLGGKTYWLDGTRTGDSALDRIDVPDFGWGLPLIAGAELVHIVPLPRTNPDVETKIVMDATAGVFAPVSTMINQTLEGDAAVALNAMLSAMSGAQRDQFFQGYAKGIVDDITESEGSFTFDKSKSELRLATRGTAKIDWSDSFFHLPSSSIAFKPDFERTAGPMRDAPIAVSYPHYGRSITTVHLPPGYLVATAPLPPQVHETLAGVEYERKSARNGDTFTVETVERSLVPEVSYKEALAAAPRLRALADQDVSLRRPANYRATAADLEAMAKDEPASANELVDRGNTFMDSGRYDDAIADFTKALAYEPDNLTVLADRGIAYVWKRRFDEAAKDLNVALARDPRNAVALRAFALMSQLKGDCTRAVELYTQSLEADPGNAFALGQRGQCEASLSKDDQALADFAKGLEANPSSVDLHVARVNILFRRGKRDLVEAEADAMTRDNPRSNLAWVGAAKIYSALGMRAKAMQAMDRALAIKPEAYVYVNRAQVRPTADVSGQLSDLDEALKLQPGMPEALSIKASILAKRGKYAEALGLYDQMPKSTTDQQWIDIQRAVLLYKAGRVADAKHAFATLRSTAKSAIELNSICWAEGTAGIMLDDAVEECREAVKQSGGAAQYVDSLGMALLQSGKLDEALAAYDQAIEKAPLSASHMGRAIIYARKGDSSRANAELELAKKLDADIEDRFADYGLKL